MSDWWQGYKKWLLGGLGAIFIGAVGSGAWEVGLKPLLVTTGTLILGAVNLVVANYQESIYQHIAKGYHEHSSLQAHGMFMGGMAGVFLALITAMWMSVWRLQRRLPGGRRPRMFGSSDRQIILRRMKVFFTAYSFFGAVICVALFVNTIALSYETRAIAHFRQLISIVAPHVPTSDVLRFESRFSQISNSDDFRTLVTELEAEGKARGLRIPEFAPW